MDLSEQIRKLYQLVGNLNLFICFYNQKNEPDIVKLREKISRIKQLISEIEMKINSL